MAVIRLTGFMGQNMALHPSLLPETIGVSSTNQRPGYGDLRPWNAPANVGISVASGTKTIYRMGRNTPSDTASWLQWPTVVHAVMGPNPSTTGERTYFTGSGTPKWTDLTKAIAGATYPNASRELGIPAPTTACSVATTTGGTTAGTSETVFYTYTYVTDAGEESSPAPVSAILTKDTGAFVNITSLAAVPSGSYGIITKRIYRTKSGSSSTEFFYLCEVLSTATTASDTLQTLGEVLPTATWLPAPSNLTNLTAMWNGMMAGISDKAVRICEAYVPYAWPVAYEILPSDTIPVALGTFGQNLVILTNGKPIVATGGSPDALDEQPIDFLAACVSSRSAVSIGSGVVWASPDGLAYIGSGGARLLTLGIINIPEWKALKPETMVGYVFDQKYYATYTVGGVTKTLMIDPLNTSGMYFFDFAFDAAYVDQLQDIMYTLNGSSIQKWDSGSPLTATFKSKLYILPKPAPMFARAQVRADSYTAVTFKLYADGALVHTQTVTSNDVFTLPQGMAREYQIEVSTTSPLQSVAVAHSVEELRQV